MDMKKKQQKKSKKNEEAARSEAAEVIEVISPVQTARLINRSLRPGARLLEYQLLRFDGVVFVRIVRVLAEGKVDDDDDRPRVGTWIKSLIPLDVFLAALEAWWLREDALPATFVLPTERTKDCHPFPGRLRVNSTLRGHMVAIFRAEELVAEHFAPSTLRGGRVKLMRAGYRSKPTGLPPAEWIAELRARPAIVTEPWDPKRVYRALQPALEQLLNPGQKPGQAVGD
jgi:hypothetical protein